MKSSLFRDAFTKKHEVVEDTELLRTYHGYISLISCVMGGNIKGILPITYMHDIKLQTHHCYQEMNVRIPNNCIYFS